jgi:endonuclease-3
MKSKSDSSATPAEKKHAKEIFSLLKKEYPEVRSALNFSNAFQLLIATILAAQCTDERVNIVTKDLFKKYKAPADFLAVPNEELEKDIFSTGFYRQKAKSIKNCCAYLVENYKGKVPEDFDEINKIPGVGRSEFKLTELLPEEDWINSSHWLAAHGRKICNAKKPKCLQCVLGNVCPSFNPANG